MIGHCQNLVPMYQLQYTNIYIYLTTQISRKRSTIYNNVPRIGIECSNTTFDKV